MYLPEGYVNIQWAFRTIAAQNALTALAFEEDDGFAMNSALEEARDLFEEHLSEFIHDGWQGDFVRISQGTSDPSAPIVGSISPWQGGTATSEGTTPQVSYLIRKQTALGGRKGRGRMFIPGPPEAAVDAYGMLSETQLAALADAFTDFMTEMIAGANFAKPVLLHTEATPPPSEITGGFPDPMVATQRRRLRN